jgi:transcriptional regulator with XRE-family HTH domain
MRIRSLNGEERRRFGSMLRQTRERARISLRAAARKVGISATYLSKMERGEFGPPGTAVLERLAVLLCVDAWWLCRRAGHLPDELCLRLLHAPSGVERAINELLGSVRQWGWQAQVKDLEADFEAPT